VIFSLKVQREDSYILTSVSYRIELLPRKPPYVKIPPHIYGELIKTKKGMSIFRESGHIPSLLEDIENPNLAVLQKRAAIWGLGHAGSTDRGA
jgi:rapamycin-insensitive companion of mTOR